MTMRNQTAVNWGLCEDEGTRQTTRKEQLLVVLRNEQVSLSNTEVLQLGQKLSVDLLGIVIYDILNMDNIHIDHIRM